MDRATMNGIPSSQRLALRLRRRQRQGGEPASQQASLHVHHAEADQAKAEALKQINHLKEQLIRTQAEFDNFRKRQRRENQQMVEQANKAIIEGLLPVIDNFDRAMATPGDSVESLLAGLEMVHRQLRDNLQRDGLERIGEVGEPFDPNRHEAVATGEPTDTVADNQVLDVLQPGYTLKGRLIRPAMVRVARAG
jgi:molecular chaperone GrpE